MPRDSVRVLQLPLFVHDIIDYLDAVARYEAIRPVLTGQQSLRQQSQQTGINYWRLWRDLRRFRRHGLWGLVDRRTLRHPRGRPVVETLLPRHLRQHIVRLALAPPFTARELARIIRDGYHYAVDYRGIQRLHSVWNRPWDLNTCWCGVGPTGNIRPKSRPAGGSSSSWRWASDRAGSPPGWRLIPT
jgi:hypothetical protein